MSLHFLMQGINFGLCSHNKDSDDVVTLKDDSDCVHNNV